jgi:hypothetical protein
MKLTALKDRYVIVKETAKVEPLNKNNWAIHNRMYALAFLFHA